VPGFAAQTTSPLTRAGMFDYRKKSTAGLLQGVTEAVGVSVGVRVGVALGACVTVGVDVGPGVGVRVRVGVRVGAGVEVEVEAEAPPKTLISTQKAVMASVPIPKRPPEAFLNSQ
jgi:hypothetical protein